MDNENCGETVYSADKESIHVEHDYCRMEITCHTVERKDDGLGEKSTEHAIEKWTDGPSVQVPNDDDCNKCKIPAIMGEVLSRASTIFSALTPNSLSQGREESPAETPLPAESAEPEESPEVKSQSASTSECETQSADLRRSAPDDSGMISQESELPDSITPDLEFLRDVPTQLRPIEPLTPVGPSPACRRTLASVPARGTSIHSQPTQILTGSRELPDFLHAFGSMLPSNSSNSSSPPPSLTAHYPPSEARAGVVDFGTQCDDSNNASPPSLTPNYRSSDSERTVRADMSDASEADTIHLERQYENSKNSSPTLFSTDGRSALTDRSDRGRAVIDLETQYENSNSNGSQPLFSPRGSPPSDSQETALTDTLDARRAVIDLETQYENSNGSPPLFSTENYPSSDSQETALTDTSDSRRTVVELETQYENSNGSPQLFSTENYPPSDSQETALTDTSDARRAVIDLETQYENSNSGAPVPSFSRDYPLSVKQGTSVTDFSDNGPCHSDFARDPPRSLASRAGNAVSSGTRQEVNDLDTRYDDSDSNGSILAQSITSNPKLSNIQRVIDRQIGYENSNFLELTGSTVSITEFLGAQCSVDKEDEPVQTRSPFRQDVDLVARNKQTPKRKREEEPESLWTDEDYSQSGSPVLEIMSNNFGRLSKLAADPCSISIGTNLSAPDFFTAPAQNPENVNLDNCHSGRTRKSSAFRTLESEGPESANGAREESAEIRTVSEFSGSDTSNLMNFERRRVKTRKRKIDFCESKENRPAKKLRVRDETPRRPTDPESPHLGTHRASLRVPRESDRTGAGEFSEGLLSIRCSEYDHIFPNAASVDGFAYEPILLRHLVEPDYETVKQKIDVLITCIEGLGENF